MGWNPSTQRITWPISIVDISEAVEYDSLHLGELVRNGNINKWAKYKPFRSGAIFHDRYNDANSNRLAALRGSNFGLVAPDSHTSIGDAFGSEWTYGRPIVGTHKYRILDFENYKADAVAPCRVLGDITVYLAYQNTYSFFVIRGASSSYAIGWDELLRIQNFYLCVAFSKTADFSGTIIYKTTSQRIREITPESAVLSLSQADLNVLQSNGYGYYYICATSLPKTSLTDATLAAQFIACPYNSVGDDTGKFTLNTRIVSSIRALAYSQSANPTSDANFNVSPYSVMNCPPYYVHIKATVTAMSDFETILTESNLAIRIVGTFHGQGITIGDIAPRLYDSNFIRQSGIRISAGTTATVYFVIPAQILAFNANGVYAAPPTGRILTSTLIVSQSGYDFGTFRVEAQN